MTGVQTEQSEGEAWSRPNGLWSPWARHNRPGTYPSPDQTYQNPIVGQSDHLLLCARQSRPISYQNKHFLKQLFTDSNYV